VKPTLLPGLKRSLLLGAGLVLILVAVYLPTGWYDELPISREELSTPPIAGVTLVRLCFAVEGLLLLWVAWRTHKRDTGADDAHLNLPSLIGHDLRHPGVWLALITVLAAALRIFRLDADLWLDEITTVLGYRGMSPFHLITAYTSSNNHLLNTLLLKGSMAVFGVTEWAIRMPALIFGIAGIPAQYLLARLALHRREAMISAFLLAVSYHHIFFSQNARGYTAHFVWTSLGTYFLLRLLTRGRKSDFVLYVVTMFLCLASILYGWMVWAGHITVLGTVCLWRWHRSQPFVPLLRRLLAALGLVGLLGFHLNASIIPQVYAYVTHVYTTQATGYSAFSLEFLSELKRGIVAGFGQSPLFAAMAGLVVISAIAYCAARRPVYCLALFSPLLVTATVLLLRGLLFSPRFFLWALPVTFIAVPMAAEAVGRTVTDRALPSWRALRWLGNNSTLLVALVFLVVSVRSYPYYYTTPKQPTRRALQWILEQKQEGDVLATAYLAEWGVRFYGPQMGLEEGRSFLVVRSAETLQDVEKDHPDSTIWILTTFSRALSLDRPGLYEHITSIYRPLETFPATIGNGEITIWRSDQRAGGENP